MAHSAKGRPRLVAAGGGGASRKLGATYAEQTLLSQLTTRRHTTSMYEKK